MGMFHSTSGKFGFEPHVVLSRARLSRDELLRIMTEEDKLRASKETQEAYSQALRTYNWNGVKLHRTGRNDGSQALTLNRKMDSILEELALITTNLQEHAIELYIPSDKIRQTGMGEYLKALRNARFEYRNDDEMNNLTVYQRYDKSKRGELGVGMSPPNILLNNTMGDSIDLLSLQNDGKPLVLICGSIS